MTQVSPQSASSQSHEDAFLWPCGSWCYRDEVHGMTHMSDDYQVLPFDSPEWHRLTGEVESTPPTP